MKRSSVSVIRDTGRTITASCGSADCGAGEEPSVRLDIRYDSAYRLKRRRDVHFQFPAAYLNDILQLLQKIKHESGRQNNG